MKRTLILTITLVLLLAGCRTSEPAPLPSPTTEAVQSPTSQPTAIEATATSTPTVEPSMTPTLLPSETPTPAPQDYGPQDFPGDVNPLTGLKVGDATKLDRRPVAIKVQLFPRGQRPVVGVSMADVVYDYYQNNGLTRLNAVFYSQDAEQVGPIRSARLFDGAIVRMYKAIFAFGGADARILTPMLNSDYGNRLVLEGSSTCPALCRQDPNGYNFLIGNTAEIGKYAASRGVENTRQDLSGNTFKHQPPEGGSGGTQLSVRYSISAYVRWDYDPATGRYLRFQDAEEDQNNVNEVYTPFIDGLTNQQIGSENVVVLLVNHEFTLRQANNEIVNIQLGGSGKAYAFRDGLVYQLQWNRPAPEAQVLLTFPDGTPYSLKPGTTWYQVMGAASLTQVKENGAWRFELRFP